MGGTAPHYPAAYASVIAVGAVDSSNLLASFSTHGSWVDVVAPGVNIASTYPENLTPSGYLPYAYMNGTSMATPCFWLSGTLLTSASWRNTNRSARCHSCGSHWFGRSRCWYNILLWTRRCSKYCVRKKQDLVISINELAWAGSSASTSDEWIEIRNMKCSPQMLEHLNSPKIQGLKH